VAAPTETKTPNWHRAKNRSSREWRWNHGGRGGPVVRTKTKLFLTLTGLLMEGIRTHDPVNPFSWKVFTLRTRHSNKRRLLSQFNDCFYTSQNFTDPSLPGARRLARSYRGYRMLRPATTRHPLPLGQPQPRRPSCSPHLRPIPPLSVFHSPGVREQ